MENTVKTNPWMASTFLLIGILVGFVVSQFSGDFLANVFVDKPPTSAVGVFKVYAKELGLNKGKFNDCVDSGATVNKIKEDLNMGIKYGVNGTPAFFINGRPLEGAQPYAEFQKIFESLLADKASAKTGTTTAGQLSDEEYETISDEMSSGITFRGSADAPITIIEFSDFQCPFCSRFFEQSLPRIEENYIKTGKVKIGYRNFPLPPEKHPHAEKAAEASVCADEQGKFWEMHDKLFSWQTDWSSMTKTTDRK